MSDIGSSVDESANPPGKPFSAGQDSLLLKWGTLKGWDARSDGFLAALKAYGEIGEHSASAMMQHDDDEQREALCAVIDACDGEIVNDWSGERMTKDEAKKYVREYRR